ncbi:DUF4344 domain-containing metallopeptidase [Nonomuraea sp. NBC_01738]|uniref:DUF4344 domain-containing metallopeptidase n=1 Tax=Nonomuraea sp. NBC_01738 TaxID=2976003 RepID=UPI002E122B8D|nr:DUF4344 domain-containing metallopeptidase [Nonomuraea sp. NBC_01738]
MKALPFVLAVAAVFLVACGSTAPAKQQKAVAVPYSFHGAYEDPTDVALAPMQTLMRDAELVQGWTASANEGFVPPVNVLIAAGQCDTVNAFYNPADHSVSMCYEMAEYLRSLFTLPEQGETATPAPEDVDEEVAGALNGIFYHEFGHALIDLYDLPTTGKEEDAVDQLSALVLIRQAEDEGDYSDIISTINAWGRIGGQEAAVGGLDDSSFADEHSLSRQRYYTMMCYLYGSDHNAFLPLVSSGELPVERAQQCESEYNKMTKAWARLLAPHMRAKPPTPVPTTS